MRLLLAPGVIAGLLVFAAAVASYFNLPRLAAILSHPEAVPHVTALVVGFLGLGALVAGVLRGGVAGTHGPAVTAPGVLAGFLVALGAAVTAAGYPAIGALISDPNTAAQAMILVSGGGAVLAGLLGGVEKPAP